MEGDLIPGYVHWTVRVNFHTCNILCVVVGSLLVSSCGLLDWVHPDSQGASSTEIELTTDHVAGVEFSTVLAQVREASDGRVVKTIEWTVPYGTTSGTTIGKLNGLPRAMYQVCLKLQADDGRVINQGCTDVTLADDMKVPFIITQSCNHILCPGENDDPSKTSCVAGKCVEPACVSGLDTPGCTLARECASDGECTPQSSCSASRCVAGVCVSESKPGACEANQWCDPARGGRCEDFPSRATVTTGNCNEICIPTARACWTGFVNCTAGGGGRTCDDLAPLPVGTPCEGDKVCDEHGVCGGCEDGIACDTGDDCTVGRLNCDTMACEPSPAPEGTLCANGTKVCNAKGECGPCEDGVRCGEGNLCGERVMNCETLTCETVPQNTGAGCDDDGAVCQADGSCDTCEEGQPCAHDDSCGEFVQRCQGAVISCELDTTSAKARGTSCDGGRGECNGDGHCNHYLRAKKLALGGPSEWVETSPNCAIVTDGSVACWGPALEAWRVKGLPEVKGIARNLFHSCAWNDTDRVYCWGSNATGELGWGPSSAHISASVTAGPSVVLPEPIIEVAVTIGSTCALGKSGQVYCWGANDLGQVGDGTFITPRYNIRANLVHDAKSIFSSQRGFCAITKSGGVKCWGSGLEGQLGLGADIASRSEPALSKITTGATMGTHGMESSNCVILKSHGSDTAVQCWGFPDYCNIGNGTWGKVNYRPPLNSGTPRPTDPAITNAVQIAGSLGTVSVRLSTGRILVWGLADNAGQGDTFTPYQDLRGQDCFPTPVELPFIDDAKDLNGTCAIRQDNSVWCWTREVPHPVVLAVEVAR